MPGHAELTEVVSRIDRLVGELERTAEAMGSRPDIPSAGEVVELLEQAGERARSLVELLQQAREQAEAEVELLQQAREQAEAEVEKGRAQGREIVEQAKTLRLTVLRDMARRRQTARVQVERLRAGRDKLMATLLEARHSIDQSLELAKLSLAEAKVVADTAARRVEEETGPSDLALLSELDDAQTVGMIPDSGPVEVVVEHPVLAGAGDGECDPVVVEHPVLAGAGDGECDPVVVEHPVLAGAEDSKQVEAVFARLRSRSDPPQEDREIMRDAAKIPAGDE
ncbi:hypothetical protein [Candidatus Poriferisocius sp.]|uniref:hypothetical protein n=1 Tax=Candidatus Poriferisocius sp. TaxID=3101276 RepID=UPI003B0228D1